MSECRFEGCGIRGGPDKLLAQDGISPHLIKDISRLGSVGFCRITGTGWVGAMLYRGVHSGSSDTEVFLDKLLSSRQSVATAHHLIIAPDVGLRCADSSHSGVTPSRITLDFSTQEHCVKLVDRP
jgi:hypothetical protein